MEECVTALGGWLLFVRVVRNLGVAGSVKWDLALKQRERGLDEAAYGGFLALNAVGGLPGGFRRVARGAGCGADTGLRGVAIRIRNKQGESFGAGAAAEHCAVRTNLRD